MHMKTSTTWLDNQQSVYIDSLDREIIIQDISNRNANPKNNYNYKMGKGDQITITVWGIPEVFPLNNINPEANLRRIDSNGNIFFPCGHS